MEQSFSNQISNYDKNSFDDNNQYELQNNDIKKEYLDAHALDNKKEYLDVRTLKKTNLDELMQICENFGIKLDQDNLKKHELISIFLTHIAEHNKDIYVFGSGVLEILADGFGFLRSEQNGYSSELDDIYVNANQINKFKLRQGDIIVGGIRIPNNKDDAAKKIKNDDKRHLALSKVDSINYIPINDKSLKNRPDFDNLTPLFPNKKFNIEVPNAINQNTGGVDISNRFLDIIAPIGMGQRALIVAPPKTGKTDLMKNIAQGIAMNHPDVILIVLLIDERPEEVTDMKRSVDAEVISSTFDEHPTRHIQLTEMTIEKAKRLVENKKDVVILLDSITRLARAYNSVVPSSGKVLSGGVESNALQKPKRIFGAARNVEEGGSLTIIATALIETGSKMDDVIFEEFKGTGNCDIFLSRKLAEERKYPAIEIAKSGTRKEDRLIPHVIKKSYILRSLLGKMDSSEAHSLLRNRIIETKNNEDFYNKMNS
ncbi:MAG: transcription termination factor Rho [Rickettsiales bacterium]